MADDNTQNQLDNYDFSGVDAGASHTFPMEAGQIRKGGPMCIKGFPCKVTAVSTSKTGKHGHAKCNFTAVDIFTGKKYEDMVPSTHNIDIPNIVRGEYTLLDITDDGFVNLMTAGGDTKDDLKLPDYPEELAGEIRKMFDDGKTCVVTTLRAMGHEQIVSIKEEVGSSN